MEVTSNGITINTKLHAKQSFKQLKRKKCGQTRSGDLLTTKGSPGTSALR